MFIIVKKSIIYKYICGNTGQYSVDFTEAHESDLHNIEFTLKFNRPVKQ